MECGAFDLLSGNALEFSILTEIFHAKVRNLFYIASNCFEIEEIPEKLVETLNEQTFDSTGKYEIEGKTRQSAENKQTSNLMGKIEIEGKTRQNAENENEQT